MDIIPVWPTHGEAERLLDLRTVRKVDRRQPRDDGLQRMGISWEGRYLGGTFCIAANLTGRILLNTLTFTCTKFSTTCSSLKIGKRDSLSRYRVDRAWDRRGHFFEKCNGKSNTRNS